MWCCYRKLRNFHYWAPSKVSYKKRMRAFLLEIFKASSRKDFLLSATSAVQKISWRFLKICQILNLSCENIAGIRIRVFIRNVLGYLHSPIYFNQNYPKGFLARFLFYETMMGKGTTVKILVLTTCSAIVLKHLLFYKEVSCAPSTRLS